MKRAIIVAFGIVVVIALGVAIRERYLSQDTRRDWSADGPKQACTQEALICPDGSAVGRTGPNCEFAACPDVIPPASDSQNPIFEGGSEADMGVGDGSQLSAQGKACVGQGGSWDPQYNECVGVRPAQCAAIGGTYNECASACRHNPDAEVCTLQCVQVCQL